MSKKRTERLIEDFVLYKDIFETEKGQKLLLDLCRRVQYFQPSYRGEATTHDTLFREGQKNVINMILTFLKCDTTKLLNDFRNMEKERVEYE